MAFWGACIPGNGSYTLPSQVPPRRLRITHASNFSSNLDFLRLEVKVGENQPIPVAIVNGSTKLELELEESSDVLFSVVGPTDVYLVGYYYQTSQSQDCPNPKIGLKNNASIHPERDVEPNRGKSIKNVADMDSMECNILEERLVSNELTPKINIQVETLGNQLSNQQSESHDTDVSEPRLISDPELGVVVGHDDEHNVADVDSMECNVLEGKHDRNKPQGDTSINEPQKQQSEQCGTDAIVLPRILIPEQGGDLVVTRRKKLKKRKLVSEEKIQEDPVPLKLGDDGTRQLKRKETKKKKTRKMISGEAEDIIEDSSNKKQSDFVPAKNKQAKKDKYIFISRQEHVLDDTSKMNNDTFEALPTKVKSAKTKSKEPVTSGVPNEQSNANFAHIVLGLASSELCPKTGKTRRSH